MTEHMLVTIETGPDEDTIVGEPHDPVVTYDEIRAIVGGPIERIPIVLPRALGLDGVEFWGNEDGKLIGLPQNELATVLLSMTHERLSPVVGNIAVVRSAGEDWAALSMEELGRLVIGVETLQRTIARFIAGMN